MSWAELQPWKHREENRKEVLLSDGLATVGVMKEVTASDHLLPDNPSLAGRKMPKTPSSREHTTSGSKRLLGHDKAEPVLFPYLTTQRPQRKSNSMG